MKADKLLYEGNAKKVWSTENSDIVIIEFKDDATAYNGLKKGAIIGKGAVNNKVSNHLFNFFEKSGIPTHFLEEVSERKTAVKKVKILPINVIIRNIAAGSLCKRLNIKEGTKLKSTVIEYRLKGATGPDSLINEYHISALGLAERGELEKITKYSLVINKLLSEYLLPRKLELIDFKLEFGRFDGRVILCDEVSLDTCRFLDGRTGAVLDYDRFRRDLGEVDAEYQGILNKLMGG